MKGHGKKRCVGSLLLVVTLFLCGCNAGNKLADGQTKTESSVTEETYFDFLDETNLAWEDNALDDLRAVINLPLPQGKATDGEQSVGRGNAPLNEKDMKHKHMVVVLTIQIYVKTMEFLNYALL